MQSNTGGLFFVLIISEYSSFAQKIHKSDKTKKYGKNNSPFKPYIIRLNLYRQANLVFSPSAGHVSQTKNTVHIPNKLALPKKHKQFIDLLTEFKEDVLDEKPQTVEPLWQLHHMTVKKRQREKDRAVARSRLAPEDTVLYREAWSGIPLRL